MLDLYGLVGFRVELLCCRVVMGLYLRCQDPNQCQDASELPHSQAVSPSSSLLLLVRALPSSTHSACSDAKSWCALQSGAKRRGQGEVGGGGGGGMADGESGGVEMGVCLHRINHLH